MSRHPTRAVLALVALLTAGIVPAHANIQSDARHVGHAVGSAAHDIGRKAKQAGLAIGHAAKAGGLAFWHALKGH